MLKSIFNMIKKHEFKNAYSIMVTALVAMLILIFFIPSFGISMQDVLKLGLTVYTVVFVGIYWLLKITRDKLYNAHFTVPQTILQIAIATFFSFASVLGWYFEFTFTDETEKYITLFTKITILPSLVGGTLLFFYIIRLLWKIPLIKVKPDNKIDSLLNKFFDKNMYKHCMWLLIICWMPQYIIRFPGVFTFDNWHSLAMYMGYEEMTTQHPMIWNASIGILTKLGISIGINWFAIFFITLINHACIMVMIPYTLSTIKKLGGTNRILAVILTFFVILPPMYIYASTVYNDFLFSVAFLLLIVELTYYLFDRETYFSKKRHLFLTAVAVLGTFLRYNGIYAIVLTFAAVLLREICYLIKNKSRNKFIVIASLVLSFIIPITSGVAIQSSLNKFYDAKSITTRAILSMPIQQTVRCLKEHGSEIPAQEYDAIHTVLTWTDEQYEEEYYARNFDFVKNSFKTDATKQEIASFIKAWLKLVKLYPETCFMATAEQTYYLFCPFVENVRYYPSTLKCSVLIEGRTGMDPSPYIFSVPILEKISGMLNWVLTEVYPYIPLIGFTVSQGVYTFLLIVMSAALLFRKDRRALLLTIPMYAILGITFLGPAVYNNPRYTYPIMYCMPVLIFVYILSMPRKEREHE